MTRVFEFPEEDVKEMNRMMFTLYKFFSQVLSGIESKDRDWTNRHEINKILAPHEYYKFVYGDKKLAIHMHRNGEYSLDAFNVVLTKIPPYTKRRTKNSIYRVSNYYGCYKTLKEAVLDFNSVVHAFVNNELGVFF